MWIKNNIKVISSLNQKLTRTIKDSIWSYLILLNKKESIFNKIVSTFHSKRHQENLAVTWVKNIVDQPVTSAQKETNKSLLQVNPWNSIKFVTCYNQVKRTMKKVNRRSASNVPTNLESTMRKICASTVIIDVVAQRKLGLAPIKTDYIIQKVSAKIVILQNIIEKERQQKLRKSLKLQRKTQKESMKIRSILNWRKTNKKTLTWVILKASPMFKSQKNENIVSLKNQ